MITVDRPYREPRLTELYDALCTGRPDFAFYVPLVLAAGSVLDVGCGTGELLRLAREAGHPGRLCGLDPAQAMLDVARARQDVKWRLGTLASFQCDERFDLVVMTGHAFQVLLSNEEITANLAKIRALLAPGGRHVFETRNPLARAWEQWNSDDHQTVVRDARGNRIRVTHDLTSVNGELVTFTMTFTNATWPQPMTSTSTLRFLNRNTLNRHLAACGLAVEAQYGDWDQQAWTPHSPEISTIARPTDHPR